MKHSWLSRTAALLRDLFLETSTRSVELFSAIEAVVLGVLLLLPPSTFRSSPSYDGMARLMPETGWGVLLLVIGLVQLAGLPRRQDGTEAVRWRRSLAMTSGAVYAFMAAGFVLANPLSTAVVTYTLLALSQFWAYVRLEVKWT